MSHAHAKLQAAMLMRRFWRWRMKRLGLEDRIAVLSILKNRRGRVQDAGDHRARR